MIWAGVLGREQGESGGSIEYSPGKFANSSWAILGEGVHARKRHPEMHTSHDNNVVFIEKMVLIYGRAE